MPILKSVIIFLTVFLGFRRYIFSQSSVVIDSSVCINYIYGVFSKFVSSFRLRKGANDRVNTNFLEFFFEVQLLLS